MKIRPSIFLISDTHFGHQKMIDLGYRKESHNEDIIRNWNSVVSKKDVVLLLGDLTMVNKEETMKFTKRLNGRKYLILGNHDDNSSKWYKDCGFEVIPPAMYFSHTKYDEAVKVMFTHEPVLPLPVDWINIHGHLHGDNHRNIGTSSSHYDVSYDRIHIPKPLYEILALFKK